ncbi:MAG: hypothetical protein QM741_05995 [Rudaea sp.]
MLPHGRLGRRPAADRVRADGRGDSGRASRLAARRARRRGTSAGYLAAAVAAALLEPVFSWRSLWLLNLPTGAIILLLNRRIPESPRFLASQGLENEARAVLLKFSGAHTGSEVRAAIERNADSAPGAPEIDAGGLRALLRGRLAGINWGLIVCGFGWGLANFGFVLWLPVNLVKLAIDANATSALLAWSAVGAARHRRRRLALSSLERDRDAGAVHRPLRLLAARVLRAGRVPMAFARSGGRRRPSRC